MAATGEPDTDSSLWATEYYRHQSSQRLNRKRKSLLRPSVFGACLAIAGRIVLRPLAMLLLFTTTSYLSDATVLIKLDQSFFEYTQYDLSMAGGCTDCVGPCKIGLLKYAFFNGEAITSAPGFSALMGTSPKESLYDFSNLSAEAIAVGEELDNSDAICQSGINDWGAITSILTATPKKSWTS
ncbi:hypothetical protein PHYSODRAFT_303091 [Phytophthora sojae]|uniref:Uncharacterized protein n=1 Tax=Phytophthora sojae (strain P6497) TaxID=1094619 RepID=G4ZUY0_PHYSP|nr:hypothetical protein PHYSODRAFT_303091 [Phytophthora sojae]EGZ13604.1 hypothetical protein PHYSODRAFT_303091 [Phytophthora sojae]|eukprot:XP_009531033.1 hypothetical protein PHYSODRAFT_303091 [Phytophthora sojae]